MPSVILCVYVFVYTTVCVMASLVPRPETGRRGDGESSIGPGNEASVMA